MAEFNTQLNHEGRISSIETTIDEHSKRLDKFDLVAEALIEIKLFVKQFKEDSERREARSIADAKSRDEQMNAVKDTLSAINTNITKLNDKVNTTLDNFADLEEKVDEQISEMQCQLANSEDKNLIKIDMRDEAKKGWLKKYSLPVGIGASLLGALSLVAGILKIFGII